MGRIRFSRSCLSFEKDCDRLTSLLGLSIIQARLVGLVHFTAGYVLTYAAFVIASAAGKFG
jgi:hypothetical protein